MTDRRILEALRRILVTPAAPPERSVQRLRLLVTTTAGRPQPALGWRAAWHRRMAAPVIALGALLGMSSVAFALSATTPLGGVVRNVAHDVGLPVDSGRLVDIRDNLTRLRTALSAGDTKQARREATALKKRLAGLHPDEQGQLPEAGGLLEQALPVAPPAKVDPGAPAGAPRSDHLVLASAHPSVAAGTDVGFSVRAVDATGADKGVVPAVLSIAPDGSCTGTTCTATAAGPHTVAADAGDRTATMAIAVVPGPVDHSVIAAAPPVIAGSVASFSVEAFDAFGNDAGDATTATALAIAPDGACTATSCSATVAGPHTISVAVGTPAPSTTVTVTAGPADHLVVQGPDRPALAGLPAALTATSVDTYGNTTDEDVPATLEMADGACSNTRCSSTIAGPHVVTVTRGSLTAAVTFDVAPGPLDHLTLSPDEESAVAGEMIAVSAHGFDRFGNDVGDQTPAAAFSASPDGDCAGSACLITSAGIHTISADVGGVHSGGRIVVLPGPLAQLRVVPAAVTVTAGQGQSFTVEGFDGYGNSLGDTSPSTAFSIDPDGSCHRTTCTATVAGHHAVTATTGSLTVTVDMTVTPATAAFLRLSPDRANAGVGEAVSYQAEAFDQYGNDRGDATGGTGFSISPDGSCDANRCSGELVGRHTVSASLGDAQGWAQLEVTGPAEGSSGAAGVADPTDQLDVPPGQLDVPADQFAVPVDELAGFAAAVSDPAAETSQ